MPAEEQVVIIIKGKDEASKAFKTFAKEADKAGKDVEQKFGGRLGKLGDNLTSVGKNMTSVGTAMSLGVTAPLAAFAGVATNSAMKAERLQNTLNGLAGGAEEAAKYIDAMQDASLGTVSKLDALAAANRALAFGIVETSDEMAELTEIAITLGRAQGLTATQAVNDFATALSRNSPLILDNLGLSIKLTDAYNIYAESLGKTASQLTEVEKKEAFRKAALIEGAQLVEDMGGLQDDAAASAERMKAQMSDMTTEIGTALLPVMQQGLDIMGPLVQKFSEMDPATQKLVVGLGAAAAAAGPLLGVLGKVTTTAGTLINVLGPMGLLGPLGLGVAAVGGLTAAFILLNDEANETKEKLDAIAEALESELLQAYLDLKKPSADQNTIYQDTKENLEKMAEELKETNKLSLISASLTGKQGNAWKAARDTLLFLADSQFEYNTLVGQWNKMAPDSKHHLRDLTEAEFGIAKAHVEEKLALLELRKGHDDYARATRDSYADIEEHNRLLMATREIVEEPWEISGYATEGAFDDAIAEAESYDRALLNVVGAYEAGIVKQGQFEQNSERFRSEQIAATKAAFEGLVGTLGTLGGAVQGFSTIAIEAWQSQQGELANLISSLQDATKEQFMQQLLASIDPSQLPGGALEWAKIGEGLGLISPEQVKMAEGVQALKTAYDTGVITDTQNFATAAGEVYSWANTHNPDLDDLQEIIGKYAENIEPAVAPTEELSDLLDPLGAEYLPKANEGAQDFRATMESYPERLKNTVETIGGLESAIRFIEGDHDSNINVTVNWNGPGLPKPGGEPAEQQFGGRVAGPVGSPQLILAHGGEYVLNPHQRGAMGGPGGPMPPMATGGTAISTTYNIYDHLALAMARDIEREKRFERIESLM